MRNRLYSRCKERAEWIRHGGIRQIIIGLIILLSFSLLLMPDYLRKYFWYTINSHKYLLILMLAFCVTAVSLVWKTGQRIDVWAFMLLNTRAQRSLWLDWIMLIITQLGGGAFAAGIAIVFFLRGNHPMAYEVIVGSLTLWIAVELMKALICRARPYIKLKNARIVGTRAGGHSFPSGHTSQSFFLATLLSHYFQFNFLGWLSLYIIALLVGITRIYIGMHYPRDVLGGAVFGTFWGLLGVIINTFVQ